MVKKSQKQEMQELADLLKHWQGLEEKGIAFLTELQAKTDNPILREIMEIVKHDSANHRRVQQLLLDGLTEKAFTLAPEEVGKIWEKLAEHDALEEETIRLAEEARKKTTHPVFRYFLSYLLADEEKHHRLLQNLEDIKRNLYPYGW